MAAVGMPARTVPRTTGRRQRLPARLALGFTLAGALAAVGPLAGCAFDPSPPPLSTPTERVPADLVPLFRAAAAAYPRSVTPAQLAAQARVESKFDPIAVSRAGARGIMQFMPDTWRLYGVDGNHDGRVDPLDPADAIPAAARYDAHLAAVLFGVPGDRLSLVLAGYNAGPGAVRAAHGVPAITETRDYVARVRLWAARFAGQFTVPPSLSPPPLGVPVEARP